MAEQLAQPIQRAEDPVVEELVVLEALAGNHLPLALELGSITLKAAAGAVGNAKNN